jgi:hypothetical protein
MSTSKVKNFFSVEVDFSRIRNQISLYFLRVSRINLRVCGAFGLCFSCAFAASFAAFTSAESGRRPHLAGSFGSVYTERIL